MRLFLPALFILARMSSFCQTGVSIITQHNDLNRTGWNDRETVLNHNSVSSGKFGCIGTFGVDDQVYAQPLILNKITIGSYTGSVLYVATVNNTVYAFNANDVSQGIPLWEVNLNPPGQRAPNVLDLISFERKGEFLLILRDDAGEWDGLIVSHGDSSFAVIFKAVHQLFAFLTIFA